MKGNKVPSSNNSATTMCHPEKAVTPAFGMLVGTAGCIETPDYVRMGKEKERLNVDPV